MNTRVYVIKYFSKYTYTSNINEYTMLVTSGIAVRASALNIKDKSMVALQTTHSRNKYCIRPY